MKTKTKPDIFILKNVKKIFLIMKITLFLILAFGISLSAGSVFSQNKKMTVDMKNVTVREVINEIEKQREITSLSNDNLQELNRHVSVSHVDQPVKDVLYSTHDQVDMMYEEVGDNFLVLLSKPEYLKQQDITITGQVTDAETGELLPGVSIVIEGTTIGTVTGIDGDYAISADPDAVLVFSFIGYTTERVPIEGRSDIDVELVPTALDLDEVVVVGYGTQRRANLTGAVDVVSSANIANRSASNMSFLLQGAAPNLHFTIDPQRGGEPGSSGTWNIRGMGSIRGNDRPLVLVDGVEMNMNDLNPETIESVTILKDASASAVYGARAPFGVVLITTKGGEIGRPEIQYSNNVTFNNWYNTHDQVDALTWTTAYNQATLNTGASPLYPDEQIERIRGYMEGTFPYEYDPDDPITSIWGGRRYGNANYSWPQELFKDFSMQHKHDISISGGSENTQYYTSLGFFGQDGMYEYGYDHYERYNFLANLTSEITDWLSFNLNTRYASTETDYPEGQTSAPRIRMLQEPSTFAPIMPKYNINGTIQCPLIRLFQDAGRNVNVRSDFWVKAGAEIEILSGWTTDFSYSYNLYSRTFEANPHPVMVELGDGSFMNIGRPYTAFEKVLDNNNYTLVNAVTTYENYFGSHYLSVMGGYEQEYKVYSRLQGRGDDLITQAVPAISTALGSLTVDDSKSHWSTQGAFGRFNYVYDEKYLLELSARYQGSSRFAPDQRWGFFPSGSAGYIISNENFWAPVEPYVNRFKIRGSYGSLGNQNVANYLYLSRISVTAEHPWFIDDVLPVVAGTPGLISDDLTWETITTLNFGLDAGFLDNRLDLVFDWYERKTTDMIGPSERLPTLLGTSAPAMNNAELLTKGYEIILGWGDRVSPEFSYNARITLGDNTTTILKYENPEKLIDTWYEGMVVGEIWGYTTDRIMQTEEDVAEMPDQSDIYARWGIGDIMYKDLTGDGKISYGERKLDDHGDLSIIGNTSPRYNIGMSAGFNWKNVDFNMFWQGIGRRQYYPNTNDSFVFWGMIHGFGHSSVLKDTKHLDYWRPADETNMLGPNTDSYFPKPYFSTETRKNRQPQTRYIQNAAYLRLKSLQIGYSIPQRITERAFIQNARIYITGENLLTIKSLPKLMDPETSVESEQQFGGYRAGILYPIPRTFAFGVNLTF